MKHVILDLDNTIISAEALTEFPFEQDGIRDKSLNFAIHDMDGYYIVFERPLLQEFLDHLFKNYAVSVWTAATKDYALFIIDQIILTKPNRSLKHIMFKYHCDISNQLYSTAKKLNLIWEFFKLPDYTQHNTIIIDDLRDVKKAQPHNAIQIYPFEILEDGSEGDNVLESIITEIEDVFTSLEGRQN